MYRLDSLGAAEGLLFGLVTASYWQSLGQRCSAEAVFPVAVAAAGQPVRAGFVPPY